MKSLLTVVVLGLTTLLASAAEPSVTGHQKIEGVYKIYGGGLGDEVMPTAKDKKVMFALQGGAARQIFDAIGPDVKDACTEGSGTRVRHKDHENIFCSRSKEGEYACNFGFDLVTGKSIGGIIC